MFFAITGAIYFTGAFALLAGGLYWRRASSTGAMCALLAGCTAIIGLDKLRLAVGRQCLWLAGLESADEAAGQWLTSARVGLASVAFTVIVFVVVSLLFPDRDESAAERELQ